MLKQIFIINGSGGVGKDTFISLLQEYCENIMNYSSVSKIKSIAKEIGWHGGKSDRDRKFLSDLKILCTEYNDLPFKTMVEEVNQFNNRTSPALFLHIREPNEIERAKKEFNAKTILVKRNDVSHITSNMADEHVFEYTYDIVINNNSDIDNLKSKAEVFFKDFINHDLKEEY